MKSFLHLALASFTLVSAAAQAQTQTSFSYQAQDEALSSWGYAKSEVYDIAIRLDDPRLVGTTITKLSVPFPADNCTDFSFWLSNKLTVASRKNVPDICSVDAVIENGILTATLPQPYTITSDGVYAGYTFSTSEKINPVTVVNKSVPNSFWVHTRSTQLSWKDLSAQENCCSPISVTLTGDFQKNCITIAGLPDVMELANEDFTVPAIIKNIGSSPVSSIDYMVVHGDNSTEYHFDAPYPLAPGFLETAVANLRIGKFSDVGDNLYRIYITKVNGDGSILSNDYTGHAHAASFVAVNRPLMEEYTGLNCGYCTRGLAALERMYRLYPDRFVGVSYHRDDNLQFTSKFPVPVNTFALPTAFINRSEEVDPYFGPKGNTGYFPIEPYWQDLCQQKVDMSVDVTATWQNDEQTIINVDSQVTFARSASRQYRMAYILVTDGLTDPTWIQANYYSGDSAEGMIEEMKQFCEGPKNMLGFVYNDVGIMFSAPEGEANSLPENPTINVINSHRYTFDVSKAVSLYAINLAPDKSKLRVVALVVDDSGHVYNCNVAKVGFSGIDAPASDSRLLDSVFYDLSGNVVTNPTNGLFIRIDRMADGSRISRKIIVP